MKDLAAKVSYFSRMNMDNRNHKQPALQVHLLLHQDIKIDFAFFYKWMLLHIPKFPVLQCMTKKRKLEIIQLWKRARQKRKDAFTWPEKNQTDAIWEQSGQEKWPLAWHLAQAMDCTFDPPPPSDWYKSLSRIKPKGPPLTSPTPLHFEHAIILRLPHLLHMPKELNISRLKIQHLHVRMYPQSYITWKRVYNDKVVLSVLI